MAHTNSGPLNRASPKEEGKMSPVGGVLEIGGTRARESVMPLKLAIAREIWPGTLRSGKGLSGLVCVAGDITCLAWRGGGLCQGECSWLFERHV